MALDTKRAERWASLKFLHFSCDKGTRVPTIMGNLEKSWNLHTQFSILENVTESFGEVIKFEIAPNEQAQSVCCSTIMLAKRRPRVSSLQLLNSNFERFKQLFYHKVIGNGSHFF